MHAATIQGFHDPELRAEQEPRRAPEGGHVAGREHEVAAPGAWSGAPRAWTSMQAGQGAGRGRRGVDDGDVVTDDAADDRAEQRIVGAAQQQRVDAGAHGHGEDEASRPRAAPPTACRAQERRQRAAHRVLHVRPGQPAGLHEGHELRRGVLVDLDEGVLLLDGLEVGVRADGGLGGDDARRRASGWPAPRPWRRAGRRPGWAARSAAAGWAGRWRWTCCRPPRWP